MAEKNYSDSCALGHFAGFQQRTRALAERYRITIRRVTSETKRRAGSLYPNGTKSVKKRTPRLSRHEDLCIRSVRAAFPLEGGPARA